MRTTTLAVAGAAALALSFPASAHAAQTEASTLSCANGVSVSVTGFGRGEVLHVVGSTSNFVVTSAVNDLTGQTVIDVPGQNRNNVVACKTITPSGTHYTFKGFFTPA